MINNTFKLKTVMVALIVMSLSSTVIAQTVTRRLNIEPTSPVTPSGNDWFKSMSLGSGMSMFNMNRMNQNKQASSNALTLTAAKFSSLSFSPTKAQTIVVDGQGRPFSIATKDIASASASGAHVLAFVNGPITFSGDPAFLESIKPPIFVESPTADTASKIAGHVQNAFVGIDSGATITAIRNGWQTRTPELVANQRMGLAIHSENVNGLVEGLFANTNGPFKIGSFGLFASQRLSTNNIQLLANGIHAKESFTYSAPNITSEDLGLFGRSSLMPNTVAMMSATPMMADSGALKLTKNPGIHHLLLGGIDPSSIASQIHNPSLNLSVFGVKNMNVSAFAKAIHNGGLASLMMPSAMMGDVGMMMRNNSGVAFGNIRQAQGSYTFMTSSSHMSMMMNGVHAHMHTYSARTDAEKQMILGGDMNYTGQSSMQAMRNLNPRDTALYKMNGITPDKMLILKTAMLNK